MAKVGSIKQYHSGAAYDVANIYNAKQTSMPGATKVLMHFDSSATTDECGNTWTAVTSKKCLYLNGSSYTQTSNVDAFNFGTGDFTIDFWIYLIAKNVTFPAVFSFVRSSNGYGGIVILYNNGRLEVYLDNANGNRYINGASIGSMPLNEWHHFALVRQGSNVYGFKDGVKTVLSTNLTIAPGTGDGILYVGTNAWNKANYYWYGYIDEFRISNTARWTANFTPPTGNYTKDSYTKVLMHFDSSVTADDCGNTWTTSGSPTIADKPLLSAATKKFGNSSLYLDGNSYLMINGNAPNFFGTDWDFTVDWWEYRTRNSGYGDPIFSLNWTLDSAGESIGCGWIERDNSQKIKMIVNNDRVFVWMGDVLLNQWVHRAFVKSGNHYYGFQNGTLYVDYQSSVRPDYSTSYVMLIGKAYSGGTMFQGYIDEFRISNTARWTANFTPPTSAYSVDGAITVNGNMLIRHNNANCYIPLTTTKANTSIPCLTVRHNNANYYAIK